MERRLPTKLMYQSRTGKSSNRGGEEGALNPCIFESPNHRSQVAKLVQHCRDLDGTEVQVFRWEREPDIGYPAICNAAFLWVAKIERRPFLWLEPDSIPLHPGWLARLEKEYERAGKPYMLSIDQQTPHDLVGGIGVYDPAALPESTPSTCGFDGWLLENRRELVHRTELIQHSYGRYNPEGFAAPWEFPRDRWMVRPGAQIFHKDKYQGLIQHHSGKA